MEISVVLEWVGSTGVIKILFKPAGWMLTSYEMLLLHPWQLKGVAQFGFLFRDFHSRGSQSTAPGDGQRHQDGGLPRCRLPISLLRKDRVTFKAEGNFFRLWKWGSYFISENIQMLDNWFVQKYLTWPSNQPKQRSPWCWAKIKRKKKQTNPRSSSRSHDGYSFC